MLEIFLAGSLKIKPFFVCDPMFSYIWGMEKFVFQVMHIGFDQFFDNRNNLIGIIVLKDKNIMRTSLQLSIF